MQAVTTIGFDIAKSVFQVHCVDSVGQVLIRRQLKRRQVMRLPMMFSQREYVEAGGLMSYGENLSDFLRRAAVFVDKIFKGAKPADLPIEQPTRFHLVVNHKTADALSLTILPQIYTFADEVIE
jgi:putative ABC transport system substrate-binding protein